MAAVASSDAELVAETLAGNRSAFERIVERYQAMVCSLAYSATGSLTQSEDLAQEAFVRVWKELPKLREPSKLRPWLCSIVRGLIGKALRRDVREPSHAANPLESLTESPALDPLPPDRVINREEQAILWQSLERIPELYREPLVLFYRQHQSIENVAQALELSEDVVRKRLSRGRKLLHKEVLAFVEGALERTNPGPAFSVAVLAAIPVLAPSTKAVTAGTATVAAQSAAAAKTGGVLGIAGFAAAVLGAATGGIFAILGRIQNARSDRERRFLVRASWGFPVWAVFFLVTIHVVASLSGGIIINNLWDAAGWSLVWVAGFGVWVTYSIWMTRRQVCIQVEEGTFEGSTALRFGRVDPTRKGWRAIVYGGLAAMIFGGPFPLLLLAAGAASDWLVCGALTVLAVAAWLTCAAAIMHQPERIRTIFGGVWWGMALLTLATFNLRFYSWVNPAVVWPDNPNGFHLPPAWLNIPVIVFYSSIGLAWWLERRFGLMRGHRPR